MAWRNRDSSAILDGDPEGIAVIINNNNFNGRFCNTRLTTVKATWTAIGVVSNNSSTVTRSSRRNLASIQARREKRRKRRDQHWFSGLGRNRGRRRHVSMTFSEMAEPGVDPMGLAPNTRSALHKSRSRRSTTHRCWTIPVMSFLDTQAEDAGAPVGAVGTLISDLVSH